MIANIASTHRPKHRLTLRSRLRAELAVLVAVAGLLAGLVGFAAATTEPASAASVVRGMDVSSHQPSMRWTSAYAHGARFAYVKATEGVAYKSPTFADQYRRSHIVGMIRGAYHFALPNKSSAKRQADYFVDNGGGWKTGTKTLPGALDIEWNPYTGGTCYGLNHAQMNAWIKAFSDEYHARTGRNPVIYTATSWWIQCTGNAGRFAGTNPLWLAHYASSAGPQPTNWRYTFWQNADHGTFPGDQNRYNGTLAQLIGFANG